LAARRAKRRKTLAGSSSKATAVMISLPGSNEVQSCSSGIVRLVSRTSASSASSATPTSP
jgi:hypothetical protein